jgi:hypothetical protein
MRRYSYYVGVDLGQKQDYTALCILEEPVWVEPDAARQWNAPAGWVSPADLTRLQLLRLRTIEEARERPARPVLACRHLERFAIGTPYPDVVTRVVALLVSPPLLDRAPVLVCDATGVGAPVVDLFRQAGHRPYAITITGGNQVVTDGAEIHVPKRDLVSAVAVLLETERLKVADELPDAAVLRRELEHFKRTVTKVGHDSYETPWRDGQHDDLVLAVALAGWLREWWNIHLDRRPRGSVAFDGNGRRIA